MTVTIRDLARRFGNHQALEGVSLDVADGEFCALLGPSGSGKTTLLRILAGLEVPDAGTVRFGGEDVLNRRPRDRRVGFVFQHYALFRHMSVFENVAFGLRVRPRALRPPREALRERVHELLRLVQLEGLADRYPSQLSGGQRQRVALARALAVEPRILLLDEPFGALDARVRRELRGWLRGLHDRLGLTSIFVTHDQEEGFALADRVVVMNKGRIVQTGTPDEVYEAPASPFVYDFLGGLNVLPARLAGRRIEVGGCVVPAPQCHAVPEGEVVLYVRAHDIALVEPAAPDRGLPGTVVAVAGRGPVTRLTLAAPVSARPIEVELPRGAAGPGLAPGAPVAFLPTRFAVFPAGAGVG
ncbi:MAG: sulfate/molybdate ABC transporter ATP-binding protein [Rhodospirillaceae bacterium]|nr:sulfate/molybdate ABC transporter ATP-binding protein [Rhodospirillaceae bacterium]